MPNRFDRVDAAGGAGLAAHISLNPVGRQSGQKALEITFVNTSAEIPDLADGRFFECTLEVHSIDTEPFELESLPDSFRYDRRVDAFGFNCGVAVKDNQFTTSDAPGRTRYRPNYWALKSPQPELTFATLSQQPLPSCDALLDALV